MRDRRPSNVGKSTLFNALTSGKAEAANYPFCTIDPNTGIVRVPDPRLAQIQQHIPTDKLVPTTMSSLTSPLAVKGASKGEGLGNQFWATSRNECDLPRGAFSGPGCRPRDGSVDPLRDISVIDTELIFADLDTVLKRYQGLHKTARSGDKTAQAVMGVLEPVKAALETGKPVRALNLDETQMKLIQDFHLITAKKVMYLANVDDGDLGQPDRNPYLVKLLAYAKSEASPVIPICGKIESEIAELPEEEKSAFLTEMGMSEPGLNRVIRAGYELLGLQTYFTAGKIEVRAWTIKKGWKAPQAAGVIHTDFEKGFIKAEVFSFEDLMRLKSESAIRDAGLLRLEGKEYIVRDGDLMHFRFAV